jgi:hypothetical protein
MPLSDKIGSSQIRMLFPGQRTKVYLFGLTTDALHLNVIFPLEIFGNRTYIPTFSVQLVHVQHVAECMFAKKPT